MKEACDRVWEVDALREGRLSSVDAVAHRRHALVCPVCRDRFAVDERLAQLGRALAVAEPDPLRVRRLRASVLRAAALPPPPFARRWIAPMALAALAAVTLAAVVGRDRLGAGPVAVALPPAALTGDAGDDAFAATVTAMPGARWSRRRDGELERVRLEEGTIALQVRKQRDGERFFVDLPDGEVEVRGTTFEVTVREQVTMSIHVEEGIVVFRRAELPEVVLRRLDTWRVEERSAPAIAVARKDPRGAAAARPSSSATSEYEIAVAAYHARAYADAARKFAAFVAAHPTAPEAEDASFLEASALAHDGRTDAAARAADRFLGRYAWSFHARDAAILSARGARDRGECQRARRVLEPWRSSPALEPEIESALGSCASE